MKSLASPPAFLVAIAILASAAPALHAASPPSPLLLLFENQNTTYGSTDNAWILFSYTGSSATDFAGTVLGTGPSSGPITFSAGAGPSAGSYFSQVFPITDLADGVQITATPSTRIYLSLGQPLDDAAATLTPSNPFSEFGSPSPTSTADPNWNIRWDFFETTLSSPRSPNDYGDISVINQLAIPLQVDLYKSATEFTTPNLLQSARTAPNPLALRQALATLANANVANNNFAGLPGNWYVQTPGIQSASNPFPNSFLRIVGPASGGTTPEWIGPFPSMNPYAAFVANIGGTAISATLTDTTSIAAVVQQSYDMVTTATIAGQEATGIKVSGTIETSTWDAGTTTWNTATSDGKNYEMRIALDSDVGQPTANYSLSNAFYGSAWQNDSGVSYWIGDGPAEPTATTKDAFLETLSTCAVNCPLGCTVSESNPCAANYQAMALQTVNQWMQNLFVGYDFGLVGNTSTVSNLPAGNALIGVTLNDMGSAGWAELKAMIDVGTITTADVPFFTLKDASDRPLYNQWAKIVFDHTQTAYGMQYSDMFQPLLALYSYQSNFQNDVYQSTAQDVLTWKVTILPDQVPEPGAIASAAAAVSALWAVGRARRSRRGVAG